MKLIFAFLLAQATTSFVTQPSHPAFSRSKVVVEGSRSKQKKASRAKWSEARGYGPATEEEVVEDVGGILTNDDGLSYIRLMNDKGDTSDIYLYGGVVTSYMKDGQEYIAVRPDAKMDGSKPISGGLSHCWPQVSVSLALITFFLNFTMCFNKCIVRSWRHPTTRVCT